MTLFDDFAFVARDSDGRPVSTKGYVATDDPPASHLAAVGVVSQEGSKGVVSPRSDRHRMLRHFASLNGVGQTLIQAGVYAHENLGVGKKSVTGWDTGRRRASELAEFGLLDRQIGADGHAYYRINEHGRRVLELVDSGKRWSE